MADSDRPQVSMEAGLQLIGYLEESGDKSLVLRLGKVVTIFAANGRQRYFGLESNFSKKDLLNNIIFKEKFNKNYNY